jgi:hypothetical protein
MSVQEVPLHDVIYGVLCATRVTRITWIIFSVPINAQQRTHFDTIFEHQFAYDRTCAFFRKTVQPAEFSNVFVT